MARWLCLSNYGLINKKGGEGKPMREYGIKNGRRVLSILKGIFLCGLLGMGILGGKSALGQPPENWTAGIAYDVTPQAQITKVGWFMGKTEAGQMLFYEIGIRNLGEKPKRFKLTIYPLEGDPADRWSA